MLLLRYFSFFPLSAQNVINIRTERTKDPTSPLRIIIKINRGPSSIVSIPSGEFRDTNSRVQLERTLISRLYLISPSFLQIYFSTSTLSRINLEFLNCLKLISITRSRERHLLFVLAPKKITKVHSEV